MNATVDAEQVITPGDKSYVDSSSATTSFATFFEDDGDTGYFYAVERSGSEITILDALQVYVVAVEAAEPRLLQIVWSRDGLKSALLVDGVAQAVFDFAAKRGYCRRGSPPPSSHWPDAGHQWSDAAMELFV
jgi:hypothetical protein